MIFYATNLTVAEGNYFYYDIMALFAITIGSFLTMGMVFYMVLRNLPVGEYLAGNNSRGQTKNEKTISGLSNLLTDSSIVPDVIDKLPNTFLGNSFKNVTNHLSSLQ